MQGKKKAIIKSKINKPAKGLELMAGGKYKIEMRENRILLRNNKGQTLKNNKPNSLTEENINKIVEGVESYVIWCYENSELPMRTELATNWLGVYRERLWEWEKLSSAVADATKRIDSFQEVYCAKKGFKMRNPAHAIFMLKANHGYQETSKIEHEHNITVNVTDFDQSSMIEAEYKEKKV